jgi:tRNA-splicing ligase RtcB
MSKTVRQMSWNGPLQKIDDYRWEIPRGYKPCMRTSSVIFAKEAMLPSIRDDNAPEQAANVACLPGIVGKALAMPDIHWGYGFPIGGVAAFDLDAGVISPGGIGFDINCGVRCVLTNLQVSEVRPRIRELIGELFKNVPAGIGSKGVTNVAGSEIDNVLRLGGRWAVEKGYGWEEDLDATEEGGQMKNADPTKVSRKAKDRGIPQVGSLGSGNHFLEIDEVEKVLDPEAAKAFGITGEGQVTVTIHCGSRGCGHQIATDYLQVMERHLREMKLDLPDRQLACAEINSTAGRDYFAAMAAGANFAWANRQMILHWTRQSFETVFKRTAEELDMHQLYDVAHNIAKLEEHLVDGAKKKVIVHRKGATRSFPKGHPDVPRKYREAGQPVIIPGDMGAGSYILVGTEQTMREAFGSTCHGAGRLMSRAAATRTYNLQAVRQRMEAQGIYLKASTKDGILEEAPGAYKDIDQVVSVVAGAGLSRPVARLKPVGVMKG